jgi:hypothetical protein
MPFGAKFGYDGALLNHGKIITKICDSKEFGTNFWDFLSRVDTPISKIAIFWKDKGFCSQKKMEKHRCF